MTQSLKKDWIAKCLSNDYKKNEFLITRLITVLINFALIVVFFFSIDSIKRKQTKKLTSFAF